MWISETNFVFLKKRIFQSDLSFFKKSVSLKTICLLSERFICLSQIGLSLSQNGLSFPKRCGYLRQICLSQNYLSFLKRFVFLRTICLSQNDLSFSERCRTRLRCLPLRSPSSTFWSGEKRSSTSQTKST